MRDLLDHLHEALAALQKVQGGSPADGYAVQKAIAALDVTLRFKTRILSPVDDH